MMFSVIYSVDVFGGSAVPHKPLARAWRMTERTDGDMDEWGTGRKCKHRKWCALLTKDQFIRFIQRAQIVAQSIETMGSLGAPRFGFGMAPAICFENMDDDVFRNAYVTPIPRVKSIADMEKYDGPQFTEDNWQRVRKAMLRMFS